MGGVGGGGDGFVKFEDEKYYSSDCEGVFFSHSWKLHYLSCKYYYLQRKRLQEAVQEDEII